MNWTAHAVDTSIAGVIQDVSVVWQDNEGMQEEFCRLSIAEQCGDEDLCVCGALEVSMQLEHEGGDRAGFGLLENVGHEKRAYPQRLKPRIFAAPRWSKLRSWLA